MKNKIDLKQTTFIIPVRLDSRDREFNIKFVLQYLLDNFDTNIIIKESDDEPRLRDILKKMFPKNIIPDEYRGSGFHINVYGSNLIYLFEQTDSQIFHRTRLLNEMLCLVKTEVVVNYDCDVFMIPQAYLNTQDKVLSGVDLVYPYFEGESQIKVEPEDKEILTNYQLQENKIPYYFMCEGLIEESVKNKRRWTSRYGHLQFFNTKSYRDGGMENEEFKSWGSEDAERFHRFIRLGYGVQYLNNFVFHIQHSIGHNSSESNPLFKHNEDLYRKLMYMNPEQLKEYYNNVEYLKKYKS